MTKEQKTARALRRAKRTKRTFVASVVTILLCMTMLIGATFAWFTDNDTVSVNKIVAGNLDVEIVDKDGNEKTDALQFVNKEGETKILWEPNAKFRTEGFKLKNNGNLWLKYKIEVNNTEVSYSKLNEVIKFYLVDDQGAQIALTDMKDVPLAPNTVSSKLMYIEGHMDPNAGNEYMKEELKGVSITVYATQYTSEKDIIDETYDKDATYGGQVTSVATADEFISAFAKLKNGGIISLTEDIDLTGKSWTPVNNKGFTLDGNGKTITGMSDALVGTTATLEYTVKDVTFKNLTINNCFGDLSAGLIGYADTCSYINMENVTIDGATITGAEYIGGFAGYTSGYGVDNNGPVNASHNFTNCTIKNATLTSSTDGSVGGLIGHAGSNAATTTRVNEFTYENLTMKQTNANRPEKTGNMIGTCNIGVVYITDADINVATDIGRFVPQGTGKLIINDTEQTEFENK